MSSQNGSCVSARIALAEAGRRHYCPRTFPVMQMYLTSQREPARLSIPMRLLLGGVTIVLISLLATAACLRPVEQGFGTHQQLGLPPCSAVQWFGRRCPSCGMTTAWAHLLAGSPLRACRANAGGALTGVCALLAAPWALFSAARGRWWLGCPGEGVWIIFSVLVASVTLIDWCCRLVVGGGP